VRIVQLDIDPEKMAMVEAISLVNDPAIEVNFLAFHKAAKASRTKYELATVLEDRRLVIGPAMIPNKLIYRNDEAGEYHIYFSKGTVRKAAYEYLKANRQHMATVEHEVSVNGVTLVESWIVEGPFDKARHLGYEVPVGTWMAAMRIENDEVWSLVKDGALKGFSIEGWFTQALTTSK
jgi:hypothetical protein